MDLKFGESDLTNLEEYIQRFQSAVEEIVISKPLGAVEFKGDYIFTLMNKSNVINFVFFPFLTRFNFDFFSQDCVP